MPAIGEIRKPPIQEQIVEIQRKIQLLGKDLLYFLKNCFKFYQ